MAFMIRVLLVGLVYSTAASSQEALRIRLADVDKAKIALLVTNEADTTGYLQIDASIADSLVSIEHLAIEPKATLRVSFSELSVPADAQEIVATVVEVGSKLNIIAPMVSLIPDDDILYKEVVLEKQISSKAAIANTCPSVGRYCGWELGGSATDKNLFSCNKIGATPVLYRGCRNFCAGADSNKYSFCAVVAPKMNASALGVFANANIGTKGELLWDNAGTKQGGKNLSGVSIGSCSDSYDYTNPKIPVQKQCTVGGECVAFARNQTGTLRATSDWAPLTSSQMSIASAPNGTMIATFPDRKYSGHVMIKCGSYFCDANFHDPLDKLVRRRSASTAGYNVVAIPSPDEY